MGVVSEVSGGANSVMRRERRRGLGPGKDCLVRSAGALGSPRLARVTLLIQVCSSLLRERLVRGWRSAANVRCVDRPGEGGAMRARDAPCTDNSAVLLAVRAGRLLTTRLDAKDESMSSDDSSDE
eukprot:CAMPEP_0179960912 /NCGR_PEP_ID=MMETSP0983-20121128/29398_1 /TAXON_ID=483367 /ORGANISM="non described non described, Strain CCMP 2436" /LENGTH=124 /DNA_ID=CAMNT_0021873303 /DNA_START=481 /DNA_END=855 /DNA_ORIENTATION=+